MDLRQGDKLGAYEIVDEVGRGGMATVYKAYHETLDRHVAIKLMHSTFLQDEDFRARFRREAQIVARLDHPAIVTIHDSAEYNNVPYLVMKYIDGMTLKKQFIKQGMTIEEIEQTLTRVARALDYAHQQGILHRDIKPSNILIGNDEQVYITDFGLARIAELGSSTISHDMMLGTPYYISPEQGKGNKDIDHRTDIYSLGVILYELLTGQVPFQADTTYGIVHGHIYEEAPLPSTINTDLNPAIDRVLQQALAKDRDQRFGSAGAMMQAFSEALRAEPELDSIGDEQDQGESSRIDPQRRINANPRPASARNTIEKPAGQRRYEHEFDLDIGNVNWDSLRDNVRSGVKSLAEMIEDRIDTELRQRRGIALTEQELARRRVIKRMKERNDFVGHLGTYIAVNTFLVGIWFFTGAGFFWPFFPLIFWGMGVVGQGVEYYNKYGPGASKNEAQIQAEVERELARMNGEVITTEKRKPDRLSTEFGDAQAGVRLNEEGELTDSFIQEQRNRR
ncbi:MAG: protein kinase domain-containing protein [Anaerolineae bacterium]